MTLFFYGAVRADRDFEYKCTRLQDILLELNWSYAINELQKEYSLEELFGIRENKTQKFIVYELKERNTFDVYDQIYSDFDADKMTEYYRLVAKEMGYQQWQALQLGSDQEIDTRYLNTPLDIPVVQFVKKLFMLFPDDIKILNIDQDFDNRFECVEIVGNKYVWAKEAWKTIAFGFSWPNVRLRSSE